MSNSFYFCMDNKEFRVVKRKGKVMKECKHGKENIFPVTAMKVIILQVYRNLLLFVSRRI